MAYELTKQEKIEIHSAFRDVRGSRLTHQQREIARRYGLEFGKTGGDHVYLGYGKDRAYFGLTPSDRMAGRKVANRLVRLIEGHFNAPLVDEEKAS